MSTEFPFPLSLAKPGDNPVEFYKRLVDEGHITYDDRQILGLKKLERVWKDLEENKPAESSGGFFGLFTTKKAPEIKGLYMYGGVGCGKTFIMDVFFACCSLRKKRRSHFHSFMLEVHQRLHGIRQSGLGRADVESVAKQIINQDGKLFCFDEFNVTDVGDAVILRNLFDTLWAEGAVLVATSNRPPDQLYLNGIQRELFIPCIKGIKQRCDVLDLASEKDFRLMMTASASMYVVHGNDPERRAIAEHDIDAFFETLGKGFRIKSVTLVTQGRKIKIKATHAGVASFDFAELCDRPNSAADFIAIARAFHTVILHDIPFLSMDNLPIVRRFITMIDVLYDHQVKLLATAAAEPFKLFQAEKGAAQDEAFAFDRTASRLSDMMSEEYKTKGHRPSISSSGEGVDACPGLAEIHKEDISEAEIQQIWERYDTDRSGSLDKEELRSMLQDISQLKKGHRNVGDLTLEDAFTSLDKDADGIITREEFEAYARSGKVSVWYII